MAKTRLVLRKTTTRNENIWTINIIDVFIQSEI
ncbi:unnamed protein product [Acanthoscelides obtectus]|uniref:Uncharacterized protein n=1 Tax=Acanthoscelides obtectus TaxID=200917 RepID=A0A9P0M1S2_ACAOB|nr:unnamed protein product [Acanthoscelides obtectus]CAK1619969.1 hypothetical protein AOBTE_LOCUS105 [Acanthoscelides obtectus]